MQRDDELVRRLMLDFEASPEPLLIHELMIGADPEDRRVYYHLQLLADEGLLEESGRNGGVFRMTASGHDFCSAVRDDTIWRKTKDASVLAANASLVMMKDIGLAYLRARLIELGVPLA